MVSVERLSAGVDESPREVPVEGGEDAVLLPGLADSHLHLVATATSLCGLDLSSDHPGSIDDLVERLAT
ncbi:MAG: hypothetical protein ACKPBU_14415, partial [Alphaproteobacteria bacterium]